MVAAEEPPSWLKWNIKNQEPKRKKSFGRMSRPCENDSAGQADEVILDKTAKPADKDLLTKSAIKVDKEISDEPKRRTSEENIEESPIKVGDKKLETQDPLIEVNLGSNEDKRPTYISAKLSAQQQEELKELLADYKDCFAWSYEEMLAPIRTTDQERSPSILVIAELAKSGEIQATVLLHPLLERKSYLVWNAVGCLGVSMVSDLVREIFCSIRDRDRGELVREEIDNENLGGEEIGSDKLVGEEICGEGLTGKKNDNEEINGEEIHAKRLVIKGISGEELVAYELAGEELTGEEEG
uniref:Uncharacterized protein n=1 Tax=Ananas comosus var. bracteatus TaxID=296719 RepID=A0A6V7Q9R1_ANACO|nr:unnamed protein product [Ananas comosus var. bracteatus]